MTKHNDCSFWDELIEGFVAGTVCVDVGSADRELVEEFVKALNDKDILFPSKCYGEMPINPVMYYNIKNAEMYTTKSPSASHICHMSYAVLSEYTSCNNVALEIEDADLDGLL